MLLSESGPTDFVRIPACRPVPAGRQFLRGGKPVLHKPLQVQHPQMLRLISGSVKFGLCEVPAVLHR